jgi:hypothetical protein
MWVEFPKEIKWGKSNGAMGFISGDVELVKVDKSLPKEEPGRKSKEP